MLKDRPWVIFAPPLFSTFYACSDRHFNFQESKTWLVNEIKLNSLKLSIDMIENLRASKTPNEIWLSQLKEYFWLVGNLWNLDQTKDKMLKQ